MNNSVERRMDTNEHESNQGTAMPRPFGFGGIRSICVNSCSFVIYCRDSALPTKITTFSSEVTSTNTRNTRTQTKNHPVGFIDSTFLRGLGVSVLLYVIGGGVSFGADGNLTGVAGQPLAPRSGP